MADSAFTGPVNYLVFVFPDGADIGEGMWAVLDAVDRGTIDLLDIECVRVDSDGHPMSFPVTELEGSAGGILSVFDGVDSRILDDEDKRQIAADLKPGTFALTIVYEDRALTSAAHAWHRAGGVEALAGGVDLDPLGHFFETEN